MLSTWIGVVLLFLALLAILIILVWWLYGHFFGDSEGFGYGWDLRWPPWG